MQYAVCCCWDGEVGCCKGSRVALPGGNATHHSRERRRRSCRPPQLSTPAAVDPRPRPCSRPCCSHQPGFQQLKLVRGPKGVSCFIEFGDVSTAMAVHDAQQGAILSTSDRGGIRIQYSKNPFGRKRDAAGAFVDVAAGGGMLQPPVDAAGAAGFGGAPPAAAPPPPAAS